MRIEQKLHLIHGLMAVMVFALILGANVIVSTLHRDFGSLAEQTLEVTRELEHLRAAGQRIISSTAEYVLAIRFESIDESTAREEIELIVQSVELYHAAFVRYSRYVDQFFPDEASYKNDIGDAGAALIAASWVLVDLTQKDPPLAQLAERIEVFKDLERSYVAAITAAQTGEVEEFEERAEKIHKGITTASNWAWAGFAAMLVAIFLSGYLIARRITGPLNRLAAAAKEFGLGDYSARIDFRSRDEVGQLAAAFNDMALDLGTANKQLRFTQYAVDHADLAALWIRPQDRGIDFVNQNACKMLGYSKEELLALNMPEIDPEATGRGQDPWVEKLRGEGQDLFESTAVTKSGRVIPTEMNCFITELDGVEHIVAFIRDITERKESEEERRRGEELMNRMFESNTVPMVFSGLGTKHILRCNQAMADFHGLSIEEVLALDTNEKFVIPENRKTVIEALRKTGRIDNFECQMNAVGAGEVREVLLSAVLVDYEGHQCSLSSFIDITERKEAERSLLRASESLANILANSPIGVAVRFEGEDTFAFCNDRLAELFGYSAKDLIGAKRSTLSSSKTQKDIDGILERDGQIENLELKLKRKNGTEFSVLLSVMPTVYRNKAAWLSWLYDISEIKAYQKSLNMALVAAEEANQAKSVFVATMSHELRTPLHGVSGMAELLEATDLQAGQIDMIDSIKESANSLLRIVDDILDFSEIGANKLDLEIKESSIRRTVENVGETLAASARMKNLSLNINIDPEVPDMLLMDSIRVRQILFNLAGNAIKFTHTTDDQRGIVELGVKLEKPIKDGHASVRYYVKDNGIGIPKSSHDDLFQPFHQLDDATTRRYGGTGLGLTVCSSLAELMGSRIEVDSVKGKGSTFEVTLTHPVAATASENDLDQDLDGLNGLVVTKSKATGAVIKNYLSESGCKMRMASDRKSVSKALGGKRKGKAAFDFVVFDQSVSDETATDLLPVGDWNEMLAGIEPLFIIDRSPLPAHTTASGEISVRGNPVRRGDLVKAVAQVTRRGIPPASKGRKGRVETSVAEPLRSREEALAAGRLILVAEDNATNRDVINRQLIRLGYTADIVNDGAEALKAVGCTNYGLLLTDCHMPELDGYALAERIRKSEAGADRRLPIVAITANAIQSELERCLISGMDDYLVKPVELTHLAETLKKWLPDHPEDTSGGTKADSGDAGNSGGSDAGPPSSSGEPVDLKHLERVLGIHDAEGISEMLSSFWDGIKGLGGEMSAALSKKDTGALKAVAHSNKGAARYVGALALGDALEALEGASEARNWATCETLLEQVKNELQRVGSYIQSF